ncbi:hypothetical protein BHM03_00013079 [Ensete ventricosum]|nr:hypothetical protein BHM03_00013079 [Ensete ventricosum]
MSGAVERALRCLGRGFDVACDFRPEYCRGKDRLVVINEDEKRELAVPGFGLFKDVCVDVKCDKGDRVRYQFIENYGTHIIVGLSVGGQDVVYVKQDQSSSLPPSELKQQLDKLGHQLFTGTCALPPFYWKSKEHKLKVCFNKSLRNFACIQPFVDTVITRAV